MTIIAQLSPLSASSNHYEIFEAVTMKGIDGADVEVLQSQGFFSLDRLEQEKIGIEHKLIEINKRIAAINTLIG